MTSELILMALVGPIYYTAIYVISELLESCQLKSLFKEMPSNWPNNYALKSGTLQFPFNVIRFDAIHLKSTVD